MGGGNCLQLDRRLKGALKRNGYNLQIRPQTLQSWWFEPIRKILAKMGIFPK